MRDTFLFDLDGTVLPMDFDLFMKLYFYNIGEYFKEVIEPKELVKNILECTEKMVRTNNGKKNEEIFMEHFDSLLQGSVEEYKPMFYDFYNTNFNKVKASTHESKYMRKSIDLLKEKGYRVVLATNPLFPMIANHHRIRWAGFEPSEFEYISSFENNSYCKPHLEYYKEVLENINQDAENCYMVGNDVFDDLSSGKLGIETYLVTNHLLNKHNQEVVADHIGTYYDFYKFVQKLDEVK
jgi:FMN phosphatase YigB (HAD superfamily)